ncbi:hypothetical protein KC352_g29021, partial [Hortaea werneckii]
MGQDMSSAAAGDSNIAVKGAADAAQKLYSAQHESDTRILSEPMISSHRKESQSSKKRKRDPELENAMSMSGSRTPPHRLSNTFHRDQESPIQTRVRSRSPLAADVRRDEYRRLRDHWSPTRWEDSARSSPTSPSENRNLIDFNGLKAVPTGPKTALQHSRPEAATPLADTDRSLPTRPVLQNVDASVRAAPHAFLSNRWLPPQQATIQHLRGYFAKRSPESIFVDEFGYYLLFNDDEEGHSNMDRLVAETPHRGKLFGMYPLTLEAYHNGQRQPDSRLTTPFDSHKHNTEEPREE